MQVYGYHVLLFLLAYKLWETHKVNKHYEFEKKIPLVDEENSIRVAPDNNHFVVLGTNNDTSYLFPIYLTVKRWKALGVRSIICVTTTQEEIEKSSTTRYIWQMLYLEGVQFVYLTTKYAPTHTLSQTCRLFVAGASGLDIDDDSVLITSDSDLWPIDLANHLPKKNQEIFSYHSYCCGFTRKPWTLKWFRHYQISTIAAKASLWREIMEIEEGFLQNGDDIAKRLYEEFGAKFIFYGRPKPYFSRSWFADQILLSEKLEKYLENNREKFGELPIVRRQERISREAWPTSFDDLNITGYREVHLPSKIYEPSIWVKIEPVMKLLFSKDDYVKIQAYYCNFMKLEGKFYRNIYCH